MTGIKGMNAGLEKIDRRADFRLDIAAMFLLFRIGDSASERDLTERARTEQGPSL
jgi:hypothetical protein